MSVAAKRGYAVGSSPASQVNLDVGIPTDVNVGDWMLVHIMNSSASTTVSTPSGWTFIASTTYNTRSEYLFGKRKVSGDPTTVTFTLSAAGLSSWTLGYGSGGNTDFSTWSRRNYPNDVGTNFTYDKRYTYYLEQGGTGGGPAGWDRTTRVRGMAVPANSLVLTIMGEATSTTETESQVTLSGATKWFWYGGGNSINTHLWGADFTTSAKTTADAFGVYPNSQSSNGAGLQIAIPEQVDPETRLPVKLTASDGSLVDGFLSYWDGTTRYQLNSVKAMPYGRKVPNLLDSPFVIAHRGGSGDYSEMSMRGYTQSVSLGATGLEFSIARSSDGVYFGLHDATLNRTTPSLAANYVPGEHTWDEISQLTQIAGADTAFPGQPYMKLDDLVKAYARSHVLFLDFKVVPSQYHAELIAYIKTIPDYQNTVVGKYYHTAISIAQLFRAAGMKVWGYCYPEDLVSNSASQTKISATKDNWDYLGMTYDATQAQWDEIKAYGKPVIGHITPNLAAAQSAFSKGAVGVMASGIRSVMAGLTTT